MSARGDLVERRRGWTVGASLVAATASLGAAGLAEGRTLSLSEAVRLGLGQEPLVAAAQVGLERARNATLRAQLDRVSVKVDASLQELFSKTNLAGPALYDCAAFGTTVSTSSPEGCSTAGGTPSLSAEQQPQRFLGTFNIAAAVNVPLFSGFRVESTVRRAQRLADASAATVRQTRRDVALSVARSYWAVRRLGLLLTVQERTLARLAEAESIVAARVRAGLAPTIDQNRARLRRLQQAATQADQAGLYRESAAQLAVALGLAPGDEPELTDEPRLPSRAPEAPGELVRTAREVRPELALVAAQRAAQEAQLRGIRSTYYPQLSGLLLLQFGNNSFNLVSGARAVGDSANPFAGVTGNFTTGLQLSVNLFDMLTTWSAVRDATFELRRLAEEQRQRERTVELEVRQARERVVRLLERRRPLAEAVEVATDNLKILEARYRNGEAIVIEYLDGQVELAAAELQRADNAAQLQVAALELEAAQGIVVGEVP